LKRQLFGANKLRQAPQDVTEYEMWVSGGEPDSGFRLLIDKASGVMFLNDSQL
jgi:hypothetical protein